MQTQETLIPQGFPSRKAPLFDKNVRKEGFIHLVRVGRLERPVS